MARVKHIVGWISVVLLVVTLASIWMLTEQNVEQTSSLSESTARAVEGRAADVRPDAAQESQAGEAVEGADSTTATVHPDPLAPVRLWMGANIRRVAHTVEFFFVGLFASLAAVCLDKRVPITRLRCVPVLAFCAVCSVGDQVHKIFVPGRHFDMIDLCFDAAGYVTAMLLVLLVAALARRATCPIGAHARRR
ncbi:MAG: VanZ family protein [Collinsella sp.]|nr:VanZ family protein [Collinsella sp.]